MALILLCEEVIEPTATCVWNDRICDKVLQLYPSGWCQITPLTKTRTESLERVWVLVATRLGPTHAFASNFCEPNFQEFRLKWWHKELFLHCEDELNKLGPSWMGLTHGNVIFDILEPSAFQKYSICWVFQAFFCSTFFYMYFAIQPRPALTLLNSSETLVNMSHHGYQNHHLWSRNTALNCTVPTSFFSSYVFLNKAII